MCRGLSSPALKGKVSLVHIVSVSSRNMSQETKSSFASRLTRRKPTLKERAMAPATDSGI